MQITIFSLIYSSYLWEALLDAEGLVEPILEEEHRDLCVRRLELDGVLCVGLHVPREPELAESSVGDFLTHKILLGPTV